jgi:hypothetical protein
MKDKAYVTYINTMHQYHANVVQRSSILLSCRSFYLVMDIIRKEQKYFCTKYFSNYNKTTRNIIQLN